MDEIVLKQERADCINAAVGWWEKSITNYKSPNNPLDWLERLGFKKIKEKELQIFHEALTEVICTNLEQYNFVQLYVRSGSPCFLLCHALKDAGIYNRTAELGEIDMIICDREVVVSSDETNRYRTIWSRDYF